MLFQKEPYNHARTWPRQLESIKKQANHKLTLSKKQMDFVTKIYNQCKKNIEKNENKS